MRWFAGALAVLLLLVLLTFLLLRGIWTDEARYALELKALSDFSLAEASLNRDILEARAGLLRNYDAINTDVDALDNALARLRDYAKERAFDKATLDRLARLVAQREALVESFKTDNAVLARARASSATKPNMPRREGRSSPRSFVSRSIPRRDRLVPSRSIWRSSRGRLPLPARAPPHRER